MNLFLLVKFQRKKRKNNLEKVCLKQIHLENLIPSMKFSQVHGTIFMISYPSQEYFKAWHLIKSRHQYITEKLLRLDCNPISRLSQAMFWQLKFTMTVSLNLSNRELRTIIYKCNWTTTKLKFKRYLFIFLIFQQI